MAIKRKTPAILLMAFERPESISKVFERIGQANPEKLFFVVDGPRNPNEEIF